MKTHEFYGGLGLNHWFGGWLAASILYQDAEKTVMVPAWWLRRAYDWQEAQRN